MNTIKCILMRHSYRGEYTSESVPRKDLKLIMEAGLAAPSGCNKQTVSLVAVDDRNLLDRLKAAIEPPIALTAPAFICVLTQKYMPTEINALLFRIIPQQYRICFSLL